MLFRAAFAAASAAVALMLGSGIAHADQGDVDNAFINDLSLAGLQSTQGVVGEIRAGHAVCGLRSEGYSEAEVAAQVGGDGRPMSLAQAQLFTTIAEAHYCQGMIEQH